MKRICIHAAAMIGVALLCACEQNSPVRTTPNLTTRPAPKLDTVDASLEALQNRPSVLSDLAAQSARDVELILKSQRVANTGTSDADDATHTQAQPSVEGPRRSIIWNTPKGSGSPGIARSTPEPQVAPVDSLQNTPEPSTLELAAPALLGQERMKSLMVELSRELYATGAYSATPLRELLAIAAMSMIDPDRKLDPNAIPDLTEKERELLGHLQQFFAQLGASLDSSGRDTEAAIVDAVGHLREKLIKPPALRLATAALCTRVGGFGDYTPFEKYSFLAQSQQKAIVYLEIDEFTSELNPKGEYVTHLAQQLTIFADRDGIPVWREDWQSAVDVSRNQRQDFFTVQVITLPKALTVGKYHLKVRVRDEKSQAEAETSIPFELVADARLTGK